MSRSLVSAVAAVVGSCMVMACGWTADVDTPERSSGGAPTSAVQASASPAIEVVAATPEASRPISAPPWSWALDEHDAPVEWDHAALSLADGHVLVAGGLTGDGVDGVPSDAAALYDATHTSWQALPAMSAGRWGHSLTRLRDGSVLAVGSWIKGSDSLASAEIFDPVGSRWIATDSMGHGRGGHTASLLSDGTVLIAGGSIRDGTKLASAERYDPVAREWADGSPMTAPRDSHTATVLADGRVLVVGGAGEEVGAEGPAHSATAEIYDPELDSWTATPPMAIARMGHTATLLPDGRVLVAAGSAGNGDDSHTTELYDPETNTWGRGPELAVGRTGHSSTVLADGTILVVGGRSAGSAPDFLTSAEIYDPVSGAWARTASVSAQYWRHTATSLADGRVLVIGWAFGERPAVEVYGPNGRPP